MVIERVNIESSFNVEMNVGSGNMLLEDVLPILTLCVFTCTCRLELDSGVSSTRNYFLS